MPHWAASKHSSLRNVKYSQHLRVINTHPVFHLDVLDSATTCSPPWTTGAMSAPQGPRSRSGSRARGNARAGVRSRAAAHGARERQPVKRAAASATINRQSSHHLNPPPNQNPHHTKSWRSPSHAGKMSSSSSESWRNPVEEDSRTYKQRMSDLYQTVRISPTTDTKTYIVTFGLPSCP